MLSQIRDKCVTVPITHAIARQKTLILLFALSVLVEPVWCGLLVHVNTFIFRVFCVGAPPTSGNRE